MLFVGLVIIVGNLFYSKKQFRKLMINHPKRYKMMRNTFLLTLLCIFCYNVQAQEVWSLRKCVEHAQKNNLNLRQSEIAIQQAVIDNKEDKFARYPNLNANINGGFNFGRTIDPTTNDFRNQRIGNSQVSLTSGMSVYSGGLIKNSIEKSTIEIEAAKADAETMQNDIALQISSVYLNVLLAQEQVAIAQNQLKITDTQLAQTDKRINAGVLPKNERLEILAQQARNQQNLITAQNNVAINLVNLKNLLELEPAQDIRVEVPADVIPSVEEILSLEEIYVQALDAQPSIKASELRMESAQLDIPIAESLGLPQIDLFAQVNSNYASIPNFPNPSYFTQLDNNLGQTLGARLSIPIYNASRTKLAVERARLRIINAEVQNQQAKQALKADIQNAIASARAAKSQLAANQTALDAAKVSYNNAQKMYELGAINTLEFTNSKGNLDAAELNVIQSKYDYVFRLKIIDFYLGKDLSIN